MKMKKLLSLVLCISMMISVISVNASPLAVGDVLNHPTDHRPVPTQFEKSKDLSDLYYFPMPEEGKKVFDTLSGGEVVISGDDLFYDKSTVEGKDTFGIVEQVSVEGMHFDKALRFTTYKVPPKWSNFNYRIYPDDFEKFKDYKDGDQVLAKIYVRMISGGDRDAHTSAIYAYFSEKSWSRHHDGTQYQRIECDTNWTVGYIPVTLNHTYGAAGYVFSLNPIFYEGVMEVGGLEIINYGSKYQYKDMPLNNTRYKGCEEDAQWRKDALERIEKIRKGDVEITVADENGAPISDADISVDMYEHEFTFGVAVTEQLATDKSYREGAVKYFNALGTEGFFHKWTENDEDNPYYDYCDAYIDFAKKNGLTHGFHGHALVYDGGINDRWMTGYKNVYKDKELSQKAIREHLEYLSKRFPDVTHWDVSNEDGSRYENGMGTTNTFKQYHGREVLKDWYKWADELFPNAELNFAEGYDDDPLYEGARKPFLMWALENLEFDKIAMHGHVGYRTTPEGIIKILDDLTSFGKEIRITEFDTAGILDNQNYQGNIARDALIIYFSYPQINSIQLWGFKSNKPSPLDHRIILNSDNTIKPSGLVYEDLVYNKWWTREKGKTNADGKFNLRAYYGDYDITVTHNGVTKVVSVPLHKGYDNKVKITLTSDNEISTDLYRNDNSIYMVKEWKEGAENTSYIAAEYKDGKMVNAYHSGDYTQIDGRKYVICDYEKEYPDSQLYVFTKNKEIKTEFVK